MMFKWRRFSTRKVVAPSCLSQGNSWLTVFVSELFIVDSTLILGPFTIYSFVVIKQSHKHRKIPDDGYL